MCCLVGSPFPSFSWCLNTTVCLKLLKVSFTENQSKPNNTLTWHTPVDMGRNTMSEFHISQIQYMGETCLAPLGQLGGAQWGLLQLATPHFVWLHPVNQIPTVTQKNWGLINEADYRHIKQSKQLKKQNKPNQSMI